jgi:hypothetical protein
LMDLKNKNLSKSHIPSNKLLLLQLLNYSNHTGKNHLGYNQKLIYFSYTFRHSYCSWFAEPG